MAATKAPKATPTRKASREKQDPTKPFDAVKGRCPECGAPVQMYTDPDRSMGGSVAYPALLIHYEKAHTSYAGGVPDGWSTPPPPPLVDEVEADDTGIMKKTGKKVSEEWLVEPPAPEDWQPINKYAAEKGLPQDPSVWPPVKMPERP